MARSQRNEVRYGRRRAPTLLGELGVESGGYTLVTPCVTLRDTTEWPETVEVDWSTLVASDPDALLAA